MHQDHFRPPPDPKKAPITAKEIQRRTSVEKLRKRRENLKSSEANNLGNITPKNKTRSAQTHDDLKVTAVADEYHSDFQSVEKEKELIRHKQRENTRKKLEKRRTNRYLKNKHLNGKNRTKMEKKKIAPIPPPRKKKDEEEQPVSTSPAKELVQDKVGDGDEDGKGTTNVKQLPPHMDFKM